MDSLEMSFGDYCFMLDADSLSYDLPAEISSWKRSREDGSSHTGATVPSRTIRITGTLAGSSPSDLREKRDRFIQGMYPTPRKQKLFIFSDRYYWAEVSSVSMPEYAGLGDLPFTVTFFAGDPYEYQDKEETAETSLTSALWTGYDTLYHAALRITNLGGEVLPRVKVQGLDADTVDHEGCTLDLRAGNLLVNPSFEIGTTGWVTTGGGEQDCFYAEEGNHSLLIGQNEYCYQNVPIGNALSGLVLYLSGYLLRDTSGGQTTLSITQYSGAGTQLDQDVSEVITTVTDGFIRLYAYTTILSDCRYVRVTLWNDATYTGKSYFDAVQLEIGATPTAYKLGNRWLTTYSGALTTSDTLVVNASTKTVKKNGTSALADWAGDFPRFAHEDNLLILSHENSASTFTLGTAYRPRFL